MSDQWKLVPVEPTQEMIIAGWKNTQHWHATEEDVRLSYIAAIAAAPTQGADGESLRPVAIYQISTWPENVYQDVDKERFDMDDGDRPKRIVYATRATPVDHSRSDVWISVDERLPDSAAYVIAANKYCVGLAQYWNSAWQHLHGVTHWQPLPTLPIDAAIESQRSGEGS